MPTQVPPGWSPFIVKFPWLLETGEDDEHEVLLSISGICSPYWTQPVRCTTPWDLPPDGVQVEDVVIWKVAGSGPWERVQKPQADRILKSYGFMDRVYEKIVVERSS